MAFVDPGDNCRGLGWEGRDGSVSWSFLAGVRVKWASRGAAAPRHHVWMWLLCLPVAVDAVAKGVRMDVPCKLQILPNVDVRPLIIVGLALARVVDSEKTSRFHLVNAETEASSLDGCSGQSFQLTFHSCRLSVVRRLFRIRL